MKWPEEEQREDDYPGQYWRAAGLTIEHYQAASWRRTAIANARKLIESCLRAAKDTGQSPQPPDGEQLREWLDEHKLSNLADALQENDSHNGVSISNLLLVEAAGILFCNRPTILNWQMVGRLIGRDPAARRILVDLVERRMSERSGLREDIRKVARRIVERFKQAPSGHAHRSDGATVAEMQRRWKAKPDLHEIWFGLRPLGYIMPFRSDWHIFDLLFETDIGFAAEQIEAYGQPYQPALILQFGALDPNRRFADWLRLANCALPAFEVDGTWNGRVLLPLVLLAAQDALRGGQGYRSDDEHETERNDTRLSELAKATAEALWARSDGEAATLRWGSWLFRSTMSTLDAERLPFPHDLRSRARPIWLVIEALLHSPTSAAWVNLRPTDVAAEDELCLEAMRILAAREHGHRVPGRDLLFQMLPDEPEDFLEGEGGRRRRELPSLFVIWGNRADAIGARVIAAALFDGEVAATFAELWRRTLTLREIAEHGHAFRSDDHAFDDYARRASDTIRFVMALGISLIDYVLDERQPVTFDDRRATVLALFSTLHDATREMLAIDPIGRRTLVNVHDHLCVRRFVYEQVSVEGRGAGSPLTKTDQPTIGDLLYERCSVGRSFFESLQMLRANGAQVEHIESALESVGVRLDHLVAQAHRLNEIEHNRAIDLTGFAVGPRRDRS
ncbi:hypothetical protein [Bosea sp. 2RAB26]|uniref:hypothetical protein n=1 Tax=Bosea sp. 2RAB26 TaxID=3237476 RepID=UPI003F909CC0